MGTPTLPDIQSLIMAGIDPKTGKPSRLTSAKAIELKNNIKKFLRIVDEQDAVNRGTWYNLPCNITSQELERMLYYKGQLCFFYMKKLDKFFFMPYALDGTIDFYGRYNRVHPVPMSMGTTDAEKEQAKNQLNLLSQIKLDCVYGVVPEEEITEEKLTKSCVLLHDYSKQLSQLIIPRVEINEPLIDAEAECVPLMRTNLYNHCGIMGMKVGDADEESNVNNANRKVMDSALAGFRYIPIVGNVDFQELSGGDGTKSEEFMIAMQSLDNLRLSGYGLENGGLFEKKAHMLESENDVNQSNVGLVLQDAISIRQNFCNIVNSIWDLGIWYEPSENEIGADLNGDGLIYDRDEEGENSGYEQDGNGGGSEE